jgi:hypothetical protein
VDRGGGARHFPGMAQNREINFWRLRADKGALISSVRTHRERAIRLFGAVAVLSENEASLLWILEAHEIVNDSDQELLEKLQRVFKETIASNTEGLSQTDIEMIKSCLATLDDVHRMKKKARELLRRATGRGLS